MNGRSGTNNVEIKSGQQVCRVFFFFFFFISPAVHFALTEEEKAERERSLRGWWLRDDEGRDKKGWRGVSHVSIFLKDKSKKLPMLTFEVFTLPAKCLPFSFVDQISQSSKVTEIQLKALSKWQRSAAVYLFFFSCWDCVRMYSRNCSIKVLMATYFLKLCFFHYSVISQLSKCLECIQCTLGWI